ncbi:MAG: LacI family DNA-binding transcriptional regulator [Proteobacteria bacterium]|nr:LacI family DNA-binding transcriptional regulator [Pseudomonadota bacterium]
MERKQPLSGKVRLTEVAQLAGVSPITASRFFRNPNALSAGKRERVESAAKELGYVPNLAARALASHRSEVIGVLIPSLTNNVFADMLRGVYDASDGGRYSVQLANTRYSNFQEERLLRIFHGQKPAGLIVTGINQTPESRAVMRNMNCPIVQVMEIGPEPIDMMVGFSHSDAAFAAVSHLIERGYTRIGFVGARMDPRGQRRFDGYRDAMKAASLFNQRYVITTLSPSTVPLGGILLSDLVTKAPDIDAVFCINDDIALGVLFECQRRQIAVPEQLAIVGFNDLEFMGSAVPSLTSVRTNRYEMGRKAIEMLTAAMDGHPPQERVVDLGFEIMARGSSLPRRT